MEINENIAELMGVILGDGHIHAKNNLITITGSLEDLEYYEKRVMPLFLTEFGKLPTMRRRRDRNSYYLMISCKKMVDILTNKFGMGRGSKRNASVPSIITTDKSLILAFLRGLFDTDGCLKFSKQTKKVHYYPRVQIALRFSPLASQIANLLNLAEFSYGSWKEYRFNGIIFYQVSGKKNAQRWFEEVSPQNPVHTTKFQYWKKNGYYIPKSTLKFRKDDLAADKPKIL